VNFFAVLSRRLSWVNLPGALLITLLQRTPVLRLLSVAEQMAAPTRISAWLRAGATATASLGAVQALAGATQFVGSRATPLTGTVGTAFAAYSFTVTGAPTPAGSFRLTGTLPPGLTLLGANASGIVNGTSGTITGTPTASGAYTVQLRAYEFNNATGDTFGPASLTFNITASAATAPAITAQPTNQAAVAGGSVTLTASATGSPVPTYQWQRNGVDIANATSATLTLGNLQPENTGVYRAMISNSAGSVASQPAVVGLTSITKVTGAGTEVGTNIVHPNGNVYDQVLLQGAAATVKADPGQVLRISYVDLNDDIVQVEFAGAGTLSLVLDGVSGPATPVNYNQPTVTYMKGHAGIVIAGADETTNLSVFSVGRANAVNQALFRDEVTYDGLADIAFIAIASSNGKFGGVRTANSSYFATQGATGLYAPGVEFTGPVFIGDINGIGVAATAYILLGSASTVSIHGGDLLQENGRAVQVSGITQLKFVDGSTSHGLILGAQSNKAVLEQNGANVTSQIVVGP
jgi:hypothetical protein